MKIFILGSNGMLGRYVYTYFKSSGYNVVEITRKIMNITLLNQDELDYALYQLGLKEGDVVINCIGLIKQRQNVTDLDFLQINSVFPLMLANVCENKNVRLIHPTTDCVYDGLDGAYDENFEHNAKDIYGISKSLGEPKNATVIRTSIIGEELYNQLSFVEWVKSNKGKEVNGFTNHKWNGITCLEFAKVCERIIVNNLFWMGVVHIMSPEAITKYKMVEYVSDVYDLGITIKLMETPTKCNRDLSTINHYNNDLEIKDLKDQIVEMKEFYDILKNTE